MLIDLITGIGFDFLFFLYELVFFFVGNIKVLELVGSLRVGHHSDVVSQLLLLEELLGVVLEGSLGERNLGGNLDLVSSGSRSRVTTDPTLPVLPSTLILSVKNFS